MMKSTQTEKDQSTFGRDSFNICVVLVQILSIFCVETKIPFFCNFLLSNRIITWAERHNFLNFLCWQHIFQFSFVNSSVSNRSLPELRGEMSWVGLFVHSLSQQQTWVFNYLLKLIIYLFKYSILVCTFTLSTANLENLNF